MLARAPVRSSRTSHYVASRVNAAPRSTRRSFQVENITPEQQIQRQHAQKRPTSPHVTIYKFPLPAISSITHRVTGVALSVGFSGAALLALKSPDAVHATIEAIKGASLILPLVKFSIAFPIVYHYFGGVRHLYWDYTAQNVDLVPANNTSKALFAGSFATAVVLAATTI